MPPNSLTAATRAAAAPAPSTGHSPDTAEPADAPLLARPRVLDAVIVLAYLLVSFGLYRDLWLHLGDGYLVDSGEDQ
ncbi:MAG: hypothetical protein QOC75_1302, partial [Pseudonocardiales bacterium]|nr:hypothetical protein [Pseudonocardiales bacterium]